MFGSISPVIKKTMGYNQRQIAMLGVAKDVGDAIGFVAGSLCEVAPIWVVLFIGVVQNLLGYGLVWLTTIHTLPKLPLWLVSFLTFLYYFVIFFLTAFETIWYPSTRASLFEPECQLFVLILTLMHLGTQSRRNPLM